MQIYNQGKFIIKANLLSRQIYNQGKFISESKNHRKKKKKKKKKKQKEATKKKTRHGEALYCIININIY